MFLICSVFGCADTNGSRAADGYTELFGSASGTDESRFTTHI